MAAAERGKLINRLADLIEKHQEKLATFESMDNGKPRHVALAADLPLISPATATTRVGPIRFRAKPYPLAATISAIRVTSR
jgi:hypothetical protein